MTRQWQGTNTLIVVVLIAFAARLYLITNPLADWHSFRQADTASVTREYVKHGIDVLRPHYHDLSNIQSGQDNLDGYRMVEFPIINAGIAGLLKVFPFLPLVPTSRFIAILFSLGTLVSLYYGVKIVSDEKTALLASLFFAVLPYSVFYSRTILPEPFMLFFSTLSITSFFYWMRFDQLKWYLVSVLTFAIAVLLKPFVLFLIPVYIVTFIVYQGFRSLKKCLMTLGFGVALLPLWWWRNWIEQFPSGIPKNDWLFNSINGDPIRFRPAWFRWLFYERLGKLITGGIGMVIMPLAFISWKKDTIIYASWWSGILAYFSVIAAGNVRHDYYQVLVVPIVTISLAKGILWLGQFLTKIFKVSTATTAVGLIIGFGLMMSWNQVKGYYNINHWEYTRAGKHVDALVPADAKVIAPAFGDTVFLFQTNRTGWPIGFDIPDKISKGAQYYVTTSLDDEANELLQKYQLLEKTDEYVIIDLTQPL